jgi:hypothetical protein
MTAARDDVRGAGSREVFRSKLYPPDGSLIDGSLNNLNSWKSRNPGMWLAFTSPVRVSQAGSQARPKQGAPFGVGFECSAQDLGDGSNQEPTCKPDTWSTQLRRALALYSICNLEGILSP